MLGEHTKTVSGGLELTWIRTCCCDVRVEARGVGVDKDPFWIGQVKFLGTIERTAEVFQATVEKKAVRA